MVNGDGVVHEHTRGRELAVVRRADSIWTDPDTSRAILRVISRARDASWIVAIVPVPEDQDVVVLDAGPEAPIEVLLERLLRRVVQLAALAPWGVLVVGAKNTDAVARSRVERARDLLVLHVGRRLDGDVLGQLAAGNGHGRVHTIGPDALGSHNHTLFHQGSRRFDFADGVDNVDAEVGEVLSRCGNARRLGRTGQDLWNTSRCSTTWAHEPNRAFCSSTGVKRRATPGTVAEGCSE